MITIGARIRASEVFPQLAACAEYLSTMEHRVFVALYVNREPLKDAKRRFIAEHKISGRHFNSLANQVKARVDSWRESLKLALVNLRDKEERLKAKLAQVKRPLTRHRKQRQLIAIGHRILRFEKQLAAPVPAICFGSRKKFHAQYHLKDNQHPDHAAWKKEWRADRSSGFFMLGSADDVQGNDNCQYRDGVLRLRLPDFLGGQWVPIPVEFSYRERDLLAALTPKGQRYTRGPRKGQDVMRGDAISYRFLREGDRWYAQATFATEAAPITTSRRRGCVGVDLNPWGLALSRIDAAGNIVHSHDIPWLVTGRTEAQIKAAIGDAVREAVLYAKAEGVPLAIEFLDFAAKKKHDRGAGLNRMLSAFAYAAFSQMARSRGAREGVEVILVNPAYTSVIGAAKFGPGYGLSVHRAAAVVIARRALNFGEKLSARHTRNAPALPARNRRRHVWSDWSRQAKAHRSCAQRLVRSSRSQTPAGAGLTSPIRVTQRNGASRPSRAHARTMVPPHDGATPSASQQHCSAGAISVPPPPGPGPVMGESLMI